MTLTAFLPILASVFLHAGWNFLSKKSTPCAAFYLIANFIGAVVFLGFALVSGVPWTELSARFWWYFLAGQFFEICYFVGLAKGYRAGDISLVYPLGRALPVLLTAAVTIAAGLGEAPSTAACLGMVVIFVGCILMPVGRLRDLSWRTYANRLLGYILLIAAGTTGYTVFDKLAMQELQLTPGRSDMWRSLFYIFMVEAGVAVSLAIMVAASRAERAEFRKLYRRDLQPYVAGVFISLAYGLVLLAMCHVTNVSFVQAFRQMSLPLGVLAGILFLKESCTPGKIAGTALIVGGLVAVAFG